MAPDMAIVARYFGTSRTNRNAAHALNRLGVNLVS